MLSENKLHTVLLKWSFCSSLISNHYLVVAQTDPLDCWALVEICTLLSAIAVEILLPSLK